MNHQVQLNLLGGFEFLIDGQPVSFNLTAARDLIGGLVWEYACRRTGVSLSRDTFSQKLWPGSPNPLITLRDALYDVRKTLSDLNPDVWLPRARDEMIHFHVPADWHVDVLEFEDAAQAGLAGNRNELLHALGLYRGDYLAGVCYEDWCTQEAQRYWYNKYLKVLSALWPTKPDQPYKFFIDRENELRQLVDLLLRPDGTPFIMVVSLGGQGKTALAYRLCEQILTKGVFTRIIWASAKEISWEFRGTRRVTAAFITPEGLWEVILEDFGINPKLVQNKTNKVRELLSNHQGWILLVIDNLETVQKLSELIDGLRKVIGPQTKVLITSRRLPEEIERGLPAEFFRLGGLPDEEYTIELVRSVLRGWGVSEEEIRNIGRDLHQRYEGHPQITQFVAAQRRSKPYADVIQMIERAQIPADEYFTFVYMGIWQGLTDLSRKILIYIGKTAVAPVTKEEVEKVFIEVAPLFGVPPVKQDDLDKALEELTRSFWLELHDSRYFMHPLTITFIRSGLPQIWGWRP
jgi:hypothetical protein